jgi:hypothetical protein
MRRLTRVGRLGGVDVYLHWSTIAVAALFILSSLSRPNVAVSATGAYLAVLLLHEPARRRWA